MWTPSKVCCWITLLSLAVGLAICWTSTKTQSPGVTVWRSPPPGWIARCSSIGSIGKNVGRLLKLQYADAEGVIRTEIFRLAEASAAGLILTRRAGRRDTAEQLAIPLADVKQAIVEPEL
ncbi:MAG: hypothetical protein UZ07_CHB004002689 [Chlorobi bacterium OLB7]|nr:MAG: hypothetical protein UZ07_CHB004002689 [Chlorobi bacterium OLB7]